MRVICTPISDPRVLFIVGGSSWFESGARMANPLCLKTFSMPVVLENIQHVTRTTILEDRNAEETSCTLALRTTLPNMVSPTAHRLLVGCSSQPHRALINSEWPKQNLHLDPNQTQSIRLFLVILDMRTTRDSHPWAHVCHNSSPFPTSDVGHPTSIGMWVAMASWS